ncbi:hypothetical protein LSTR_LSTR003275 [Laodelphax striatellus]|uniref:C1q domain-containing protein n=1 Tax=Laodelphax striatellus TaxID=195883 RepID=A0A482XRW7_LAOST|nr:hypothetical protein LSTR_LSTR003275 [Laodelphax striatellus]
MILKVADNLHNCLSIPFTGVYGGLEELAKRGELERWSVGETAAAERQLSPVHRTMWTAAPALPLLHRTMWSAAAALPLLLLLLQAATADHQPHKGGLIGARKLATASDCAGAVAFSGTGTRTVLPSGVLSYRHALVDRGVGWSRDTGEFTIHCPGLYQLAFAGYSQDPNTRLTLKKKMANETEWENVVSVGSATNGGGSNVILLNLEVGDQTAVWVDAGKFDEDNNESSPATSFSAFRIIKK